MRTKLDGPYSIPNCVCLICKHYIGIKNETKVCEAFPDGIPLEVWNLKINHFSHYDGDNGLLFEECNGNTDVDGIGFIELEETE